MTDKNRTIWLWAGGLAIVWLSGFEATLKNLAKAQAEFRDINATRFEAENPSNRSASNPVSCRYG